jgi:hypothetical protein
MCDFEYPDTAAGLGLDAVRRGPDLWADTSDDGRDADDDARYTGTAAQRRDFSPPPESVDDRGGEHYRG